MTERPESGRTSRFKFGALRGDEDVPYAYPDVWERARTTGPDRLVVAPSRDHVGWLLRLARTWPGEFGLLYVLLVSRTDREPGRYQAPRPLDFAELEAFLAEFGPFLSTDGRHHLWIASTRTDGLLVYDQHDVIYAYGPLDDYVGILRDAGLREGPVRFPAPHTHHYHAENDAAEAALLSRWEWIRTPLRPGDEW